MNNAKRVLTFALAVCSFQHLHLAEVQVIHQAR